MGDVDNMDTDKKIGGSFTAQTMFKKLYRFGLMGVFNFMLVNGRQAWSMSMLLFKINNDRFCWGGAEEILAF